MPARRRPADESAQLRPVRRGALGKHGARARYYGAGTAEERVDRVRDAVMNRLGLGTLAERPPGNRLMYLAYPLGTAGQRLPEQLRHTADLVAPHAVTADPRVPRRQRRSRRRRPAMSPSPGGRGIVRLGR